MLDKTNKEDKSDKYSKYLMGSYFFAGSNLVLFLLKKLFASVRYTV